MKEKIIIDIPKETEEWLKSKSKETGKSIDEIVESILMWYIGQK